MTSPLRQFWASFRRGCLRPLLVFGAVTLGLVGTCQLGLWWTDPLDAKPFSQEAWAAATDHDDRAAMAKGAIRRLPRGTPDAEVVRLLGEGELLTADELFGGTPAQPLPRFGGTRRAGTVSIRSYYLGCWSLRYFDSTFLWVNLDADGRVVFAEIGGG